MKKYVTVSILLCLLMLVPTIYITSASSTTISVSPPISYVTVGSTVAVDINVTDVVNLTSWQFTLYFPNSLLNCTNIVEGPFLKTVGGTFFGQNIINNYDSTHGKLLAYATLLGNVVADGSGVLATITFDTLSAGDVSLHLSDTKLGDEKIPPQTIVHTDVDGVIHVQNFTLTVSTTGSGSVSLNNTGPYYHYGEAVQLAAMHDIGWTFDHWIGDLSGFANPATLIITGNMAVTAIFTQDQYSLTVAVLGNGSVSKSPNQATYTWGTNVNLTASANIGWTFADWSGDASGTVNPTNVTMTNSMVVTATFTQNVYTLTVNVVGSGSVNRNDTGPNYHYGDAVKLTAAPATDWSFQYWSGDLTGSVNPTTLVMTGNFTVTAHFIQKPMLEMSPASKTCRIYTENFTMAISISNAANVENFAFEIHYNTTLLDYVSVTWNVWSPGTIHVDEAGGNITVSNSGAPISGTQTLVTITFQASYRHIWKSFSGWTNDLTDAIFLQWANVSYPTGPDLHYERGDQSQINVGTDFSYTFSPIQGDVNNDGTVDIIDLRSVAAYFDVRQGDPNWTQASTYNLNGDGIIDVIDIRIVAANYDYTYHP